MKKIIFGFFLFTIAIGYTQIQVGQDLWGDNNNDRFGWAVSLANTDGTLAVGAPYADLNGTSSGLTRLFQFDGVSWQQRGTDIIGEAAGDEFGHCVDLNDDGQIVVIGSAKNNNYSGHLRVYQWQESANDWVQLGPDIDGSNNPEWFGHSCSINSAGDIIAGGAPFNDVNGNDIGLARVFVYNGSSWDQLGSDIYGENPEDHSGHSVSLSSDGYTLSVGAGHNSEVGFEVGHVRVYKFNGMNWIQVGSDIDGEGAYGDHFGYSNCISSDGEIVAVGANSNFNSTTFAAGHVRVHESNGGSWTQVGQDIDGLMNSENCGGDVSLSGDGSTLILGAVNNTTNGAWAGQARVYKFDGTSWVQFGSSINGLGPNDYMGYDTDIDRAGSKIAVGAITALGSSGTSGLVQVYDISSSLGNDDLELTKNPHKTLIYILDLLGRETTFKPNTPLIYVYDDGSMEKVFSVAY